MKFLHNVKILRKFRIRFSFNPTRPKVFSFDIIIRSFVNLFRTIVQYQNCSYIDERVRISSCNKWLYYKSQCQVCLNIREKICSILFSMTSHLSKTRQPFTLFLSKLLKLHELVHRK